MSENLIFYSAHTRKFEGSVKAKIRAILEQNAIEYDKDQKAFFCKPILQPSGKPYNSTTYELRAHREYGFSCSCQAWTTRNKAHEKDLENTPVPDRKSVV